MSVKELPKRAKEKLTGYDVYLANSTMLMPLEVEKNPKIVIMCPNEQAMDDVEEILQALAALENQPDLEALSKQLLEACEMMVKLYYPGEDGQKYAGEYIKKTEVAIEAADKILGGK